MLYIGILCLCELCTVEAIVFLVCPDLACPHQHFSLCTNTEWISMKFGEGNHYHQQRN